MDKNYSGGERRCAQPSSRAMRVLRGGSWSDQPWFLRSANRNKYTPFIRANYVGFRLSRVP